MTGSGFDTKEVNRVGTHSNGVFTMRRIDYQRICPNQEGVYHDNGYFNDTIIC
jgi:hypothetical protein